VPETPQQVEGQPSSPGPDVAVNRRYLMDLPVAKVNIPVADVDPSIRISLKSKALLKQMVLGVVDSDSQKCPFFLLAPANESAPLFIRIFCSSVWSLWSRGGIRQQLRLPAGFGTGPHHLSHPGILKRNYERFLDPSRLAAIFAGPENAGHFYLEGFAGECRSEAPCQSRRPTSVHHWQWNWMSPTYIRRTCLAAISNSPFQGYQKVQ
jgi:hypothetical protein